MITHLFFDIGGVLGTNGWDHEQRYVALDRFGIERGDFEDRHKAIVASLETGRITLDEYLATTVFSQPRDFTPDAFKAFMRYRSAKGRDVDLRGTIRTGSILIEEMTIAGV